MRKLRRIRLPGVCIGGYEKCIPEELIICKTGNFLHLLRERFRSNNGGRGVEFSFSLYPRPRAVRRLPARNISEMMEYVSGTPSDWLGSSVALAERHTFSNFVEFRGDKRSKEYKANFYAYAAELFLKRHTRTLYREDMYKVKELYDKIVDGGLVRFMDFKDRSNMQAFYFKWYHTWLQSSEEKDAAVRYRELSEFLDFLQGEAFDFPRVFVGESRLFYELGRYSRSWYPTNKNVLDKVLTCISNLSKRTKPEEGNVSRGVFSSLFILAREVKGVMIEVPQQFYGEGRYKEAAQQYKYLMDSNLFRTLSIEEQANAYGSYATSFYFSIREAFDLIEYKSPKEGQTAESWEEINHLRKDAAKRKSILQEIVEYYRVAGQESDYWKPIAEDKINYITQYLLDRPEAV